MILHGETSFEMGYEKIVATRQVEKGFEYVDNVTIKAKTIEISGKIADIPLLIADIAIAIGQQNTTEEGANLGIRAGYYEQVAQKIKDNPKMFSDEYRTFFEEAMTTKDIVFDIRPSKDNHKVYYNYQLKSLRIKDLPTQSWGFEYRMSFVEIIETDIDLAVVDQSTKTVISKEGETAKTANSTKEKKVTEGEFVQSVNK